MTTQIPPLASAFAHSASPTDFEYVIREYARQVYKNLCAIESVSAYSARLTFTFDSEGGKWSVMAGNKYPYETIATELLYPAVDEVRRRLEFTANAKFNLLSYEFSGTQKEPSSVDAPDNSDADMPF
jgi:hypothetical protein